MSASFKRPTKAFLANILSASEIKDGIVKHQPSDAAWTNAARDKKALTAKATLHTLALTVVDRLHASGENEEHLAQLASFLASKYTGTAQSSATSSATTVASRKQISEKLQKHLNVLKTAGLLTKEEEEKIDSFLTLCKYQRETVDGIEGVMDIITLELIEDEDDIVRLSDGHCYSKQGIIGFIQSGTVNAATGLPYLPVAKQEIKDVDYQILGIPAPTRAQLRQAREDQNMQDLEQLRYGDLEAWRAGTGRARQEFALFVTDQAERQRLATALGVNVSQLAPARAAAANPQNQVPALPESAANQVFNRPAQQLLGEIAQRRPAMRSSQRPMGTTSVTNKNVKIAAGDFYSSGILADGNMLLWGSTGETVIRAPNGKKVVSVTKTNLATLALLEDGKLFSGNIPSQFVTRFQQLAGEINIAQISMKDKVAIALLSDGRVIVQKLPDSTYTGEIGLLQLPFRCCRVTAGYENVFALKENRELWHSGTLAVPQGITTKKFLSIEAGDGFIVGLLQREEYVIGWGANNFGQANGSQAAANAAEFGRKYMAISAGKNHVIGLLDDYSVVGWGEDTDRKATGGAAAAAGRKIVAISAGVHNSIGMLENGEIITWGRKHVNEDTEEEETAQARIFMSPST